MTLNTGAYGHCTMRLHQTLWQIGSRDDAVFNAPVLRFRGCSSYILLQDSAFLGSSFVVFLLVRLASRLIHLRLPNKLDKAAQSGARTELAARYSLECMIFNLQKCRVLGRKCRSKEAMHIESQRGHTWCRWSAESSKCLQDGIFSKGLLAACSVQRALQVDLCLSHSCQVRASSGGIPLFDRLNTTCREDLTTKLRVFAGEVDEGQNGRRNLHTYKLGCDLGEKLVRP